ncbi:acetyl-CoA carboxylase biotin carboxyl carrier protein subunit [Candidatus Woesearchaeota archaeon]|nr:acetyl-CoA carboxylase biotin carboxyl carrier protein subunit [Candidatus Woesearchaeota archaeon]
MEELVVRVDGKEYKVFVEETEEGKIFVHCGSDVYEVETKKDAEQSAVERLQKKSSGDAGKEIVAPLPGVIYDIKVKEGADVSQGQSLFTLMAMKMENDITAPRDCKIKEIKVKKNDNVNRGDVLVLIE